MTIHKTMSVLMATLVVSATFATVAEAATQRTPARSQMTRARAMKPAKARPVARAAMQREDGDAQADVLNQQSLNAARGVVQ